MSATRSSTEVFPFSCSINEDDKPITGTRLPHYEQVLKSFFAHRKKNDNNYKNWKRSAASKVYCLIKPHYEKGGVPLIRQDKVIDRIIKFHDENYTSIGK